MISIYNSVESPIKDIEILGNTVDGVSVGILQDDGQYKITLFTNNGLDNMSPDYREDKEELLLPCQLEKIGDSTDRLYYDKEEKAWCIYKVGQSKIVLPVTFTISLNSFYGTTNLYMVSGDVEGTIKAKVSKSLGASVSSLNDKADVLIDKIDAMLGGRVDLDGYATIEYVDVKDGEIKESLANKSDVGHIHQIQDVEGLEDALSNIEVSGNAEGTSFDNSSNGMTATNVQEAIEENKTSILTFEKDIESLKLSVSNGKNLIANAITDKGVETLASETFAKMAKNIESIKTGINVMLDGKPINYDFELISVINRYDVTWSKAISIPYSTHLGSAIVYNNEIHVLGGYSNSKSHYKFNGSTWTSVSTLPYDFFNGSVVIYNNEIHILGGGSNNSQYMSHYKFDGNTWTSVSTLPYEVTKSSVIVYNNEIHVLGSGLTTYAKKHYKFNGSTWTSVSTLPYDFYGGKAVVYNNEINIIGGGANGSKNHYKYNGSIWVSVSTLPYNFDLGSSVLFNNEIHILGSYAHTQKHYRYNGYTWISTSNLPIALHAGNAVVYNNEIHILDDQNHYDSKTVLDICYKIFELL